MAVSDLIVSPCRVLVAPVGTTLPSENLAYGGAWPAGWAALGETSAPLSVEYTYEVLDYEIQESIAPVGRKKTKESLKAETTLATINLDSLVLAWGGTVTKTAAGVGQHGYESTVGGDVVSLDRRAWGFEGETEDGQPIRFFIFVATAAAGGKLEFSKAAQTGIPLAISALADMSKVRGQRLYRIHRVTAEPTG